MLTAIRHLRLPRALPLPIHSQNAVRSVTYASARASELLCNRAAFQENEGASSGSRAVAGLIGGLSLAALGLLHSSPLHAAEEESADQVKQNQKSISSAYQEFKERRTGHYENRIRAFSHPLKVFQYFASIHKNGEFYMHPMDFILSILPYQPVSSEETQSTKGKKKRFQKKCESAIDFFKLADTDGDGLISFEEYMFFLTLLSTPQSYFKIAFKMFDLDGSGLIDLNEFQKIIQHFSRSGVASRQGKRERSHLARELRHGLIEHFFGKSGNGQLTFDDFNAFLTRLQDEVLKLEFFSYDTDDKDTISMKDFGRSMVSYSDHRRADEFAQRIESLPHYPRRVSFEEFRSFNQIIHKIDEIQYAINLYSEEGGDDEDFTKGDLKRAIKAAVGIVLEDDVVDILFRIFDKDGDGKLDPSEFTNVLKARHLRGLDAPRDIGLDKMFEKVLACGRVFFK